MLSSGILQETNFRSKINLSSYEKILLSLPFPWSLGNEHFPHGVTSRNSVKQLVNERERQRPECSLTGGASLSHLHRPLVSSPTPPHYHIISIRSPRTSSLCFPRCSGCGCATPLRSSNKPRTELVVVLFELGYNQLLSNVMMWGM